MTISNIVKYNNLDSSVLSTSVTIDKEFDDGYAMYTAVYHYEIDEISYRCRASSKSSYIPSRRNKIILFNSTNPENCMVKKTIFSNCIMLLYWIIPILFLVFSLANIKEKRLRLKMIKELNKKGKLVKKLPYRLENSGKHLNGIPIKRIVIDYILPNKEKITLYSDARYDNKFCDDDGMVDLLIDENNIDNYYIDFEINRLLGNLPDDYYSHD